MRKAVSIAIASSEKEKLNKIVASGKSPVRLIERSKIVLYASQGRTNKEIAELTGFTENKVGRWRNRFAKNGFAGIEKDLPRGANHGGKNSYEQAALRTEAIEWTTRRKPENATHWSTRTLARELGTSHSFISRVWRSCGLKPHLVKTFKVSNDPRFEEKLKDVVGLYLNPPDNAIVLCVDEKSAIQALDRTQPSLPMFKGRCGTMTHDYKRNGTSTLFAALDAFGGKIIATCEKRHRHIEFLRFLNKVYKESSRNIDLHIVVDNYGTHKHPKVKKWLEKRPRVHFYFIPTSSSWLNLVERFFGLITERQIKRGVFHSVKQLEEKIYSFIDKHNENPVPFEMDEIGGSNIGKGKQGKSGSR